jgi:hypothetical protein
MYICCGHDVDISVHHPPSPLLFLLMIVLPSSINALHEELYRVGGIMDIEVLTCAMHQAKLETMLPVARLLN